ncbi:MAG: addiction module protein [Propionibacteriaceae bacterium]|nr:addiction module protein [Propionibacteriaceae bacterium]
MVSATLQQTVAEMSPSDREDLRDFIDFTLGATPESLTSEQIAIVRQRAAEFEADPSIAVPWEEVKADLLRGLQ